VTWPLVIVSVFLVAAVVLLVGLAVFAAKIIKGVLK
jgi:hypothetical protein